MTANIELQASVFKPIGGIAMLLDALSTQEYAVLILALSAESPTQEQKDILEGCMSFAAKLDASAFRK